MIKLIFLFLLLCLVSILHASPPVVPSAPPYIVLSDNQDEPNGYGFCIDTSARGKTDLLHTHTCKPKKANRPRNDRDNDTRFSYDVDTGRITSFAFSGFCMQALIANEITVFALLECNDHPRQKFVYKSDDRTLRLFEDQSRCISVAAKTQAAGPWVKRPLLLTSCNETMSKLKTWSVVE